MLSARSDSSSTEVFTDSLWADKSMLSTNTCPVILWKIFVEMNLQLIKHFNKYIIGSKAYPASVYLYTDNTKYNLDKWHYSNTAVQKYYMEQFSYYWRQEVRKGK